MLPKWKKQSAAPAPTQAMSSAAGPGARTACALSHSHHCLDDADDDDAAGAGAAAAADDDDDDALSTCP